MENPSSRPIYPILLAPIAQAKVWGGRYLATLFPDTVPADRDVGEIWVVWDGLTIANGALAGQTLKQVFDASPGDVLGQAALRRPLDAFPLLLKFLDAREYLSVQVHPDDEYARAREGQPFGKCELWYVLEAAAGASVLHGLRRDLAETDVANVLTGRQILDAVARIEVRAGDVLINTPGVIHALGEGVVIFELQQSSDLTYRLYDWDRGDVGGARRALHLDQGADVADRRAIGRHKISPVTVATSPVRRDLLGACQYFAAELMTLPPSVEIRLAGGRMHVLTVLEGTIDVRAASLDAQWFRVARGQSCLLPAALGSSEIVSIGACRLIRSFIPDLRADVIEPLRALGVADADIAQLGGEGDRSDLWKLLRTV